MVAFWEYWPLASRVECKQESSVDGFRGICNVVSLLRQPGPQKGDASRDSIHSPSQRVQIEASINIISNIPGRLQCCLPP